MRMRYAAFLPLLFIAALIAYKSNSALTAIKKVHATGTMSPRPEIVSFGTGAPLAAPQRALNYFAVIWPALAFGVLISAAVRAYVPAKWLAQRLSGGTNAQLVSGFAGAPLMLCSCCVVPVFTAVYERSLRLGPSLAVMLASPALNPAALALTFVLFAPKIAIARLLMAVPVVFFTGTILETLFPNHAVTIVTQEDSGPATFTRSLLEVVVRTIPALIAGVVISMLLIEFVPAHVFARQDFRLPAVIVTATIAVPIALPTFFEIPLALGILAAGGPAGAAVALLFAGPVVNLPSLLGLAKLTNWKIAATLAALVWAVAVLGGLLVT